MPADRIPIVILGGSDRQPVELPEGGQDNHPLSGYKGIDIRIEGQPLIGILIDRLRASGRFDPIYVVGPAAVYNQVADACRLIDSDQTFGRNIRASIEAVRRQLGIRPLAFITCDVVPELDTLHTLMDHYDASVPCDLWFPVIHAPEDQRRLGASSWKPAYRIAPADGAEPVRVLPGHLAVADPAALRLTFIYRLMQLGYMTRNRPISYRRRIMVRGVVLALLWQDLRNAVRFRAPTLTWMVLSAGISAARELKAGTITRRRLEDALRKVMVTSRHRRRHPERRIQLPIVEGLSLALDIDTEEEARQLGGRVRIRSA